MEYHEFVPLKPVQDFADSPNDEARLMKVFNLLKLLTLEDLTTFSNNITACNQERLYPVRSLIEDILERGLYRQQ